MPQRVARTLGANLYCARLPGHGIVRQQRPAGLPEAAVASTFLDGDALLREATPQALLAAALEALTVGCSLGERVVLIGCSTGGALATWLATLPHARHKVAGVVLLSPAFALGHPAYPVLKHTFSALRLLPACLGRSLLRGALIAVAVGGETKLAPPQSMAHGQYVTLCYPSRALLHLIDLLWALEAAHHSGATAPVLMMGNPQDPVVRLTMRKFQHAVASG